MVSRFIPRTSPSNVVSTTGGLATLDHMLRWLDFGGAFPARTLILVQGSKETAPPLVQGHSDADLSGGWKCQESGYGTMECSEWCKQLKVKRSND